MYMHYFLYNYNPDTHTYIYMLHFLNLLHATCSRMILALPDTLIYHTCTSQHIILQFATVYIKWKENKILFLKCILFTDNSVFST